MKWQEFDCKGCGEHVRVYGSPRAGYCSPKCWSDSMRIDPGTDYTCEHCGGNFKRTRKQIRYKHTPRFCSRACYLALRRENTREVRATCRTCRTPFVRAVGKSAPDPRYCNAECYNQRPSRPATHRRSGGRAYQYTRSSRAKEAVYRLCACGNRFATTTTWRTTCGACHSPVAVPAHGQPLLHPRSG